MTDEAAYYDAQDQTKVVKACGGTVVVQVQRIVDKVEVQSVRTPVFLLLKLP